MQRTYVAIALALAMTCAFAAVTPSNYVKPPVQVVQDSETIFTNGSNSTGATSILLTSATVGDLYVVAQWRNLTAQNTSAYLWSVFMKKIATKDLSVSTNTSLSSFNDPTSIFYYNNYVLAFGADNDTGIPALRAYQQPLSGGAALPRLTVSTNTNNTWYPSPASIAAIGKNIYIFYLAADKKMNVTSFTLGGSVGTNEFTLTSAFESGLQTIWGEALSTSQVFASWIEGGVLKDAVVDVSKATSTINTVGGWNSNLTCVLYTTDKKWYGELCTIVDTTYKTFNYTIRTNTTSLANFISTNVNKSMMGVYPYGPYVALFYSDSTTTSGTTSYSYDIWNLDTLTAFKNNTAFLTNDGKSVVQFARVQAGGIYTMTYTAATTNTTIQSIYVGLVLGSSYLTDRKSVV